MAIRRFLVVAALAGSALFSAISAFAQAAGVASALPLSTRNSVLQASVNRSHTGSPPMLYDFWHRYTLQAINSAQQFDVSTEYGGVTVARCIGQCTLGLPAGRYELLPYDKQGHASRRISFEVWMYHL
jgi:hypothetical protein